jgi:hypothetical protein
LHCRDKSRRHHRVLIPSRGDGPRLAPFYIASAREFRSAPLANNVSMNDPQTQE